MLKPDPSQFPEIKHFWDVYCSIHAQKGLDVPDLIRVWVRMKRGSLSQWGAAKYFDELCDAGCSAVSLAIMIFLLAQFERGAAIWRTTTGNRRDRDHVLNALIKAANALQQVNENFVKALLRDMRASLDQDIRAILVADTATARTLGMSATEWPRSAPVSHPADVVKALRFYARFLKMFDTISEENNLHSSESLPRYLLSAYVKGVTDSFHDREVSALVGSVSKKTYDEVAHRMWRSRNYKKLDDELCGLCDLLVGIGVVCMPPT